MEAGDSFLGTGAQMADSKTWEPTHISADTRFLSRFLSQDCLAAFCVISPEAFGEAEGFISDRKTKLNSGKSLKGIWGAI